MSAKTLLLTATAVVLLFSSQTSGFEDFNQTVTICVIEDSCFVVCDECREQDNNLAISCPNAERCFVDRNASMHCLQHGISCDIEDCGEIGECGVYSLHTSTSSSTVVSVDREFEPAAAVYYQWAVYIIIIIAFVLLLTSCLFANCISRNDFYSMGAIISATVHFLDTWSDIFFAIHIPSQSMLARHHTHRSLLWIIFVACVSIVVISCLLTMIQLHRAINKWKRFDELNAWILQYGHTLYILSVFCGSAFTGIQLCRSNMFDLRSFDMPLSHTQFLSFNTKRLYSTVLFENIPQLGLQIWYLQLVRDDDDSLTVYASVAFSALSVFVFIFSSVSRKSVLNARDVIIIEYDVKHVSKRERYRNQSRGIQTQLSALLGIERDLMQVLKPSFIRSGLRCRMELCMNKEVAEAKQIQLNLKQMMETGRIAEMMKDCWHLQSMPYISDFSYKIRPCRNMGDDSTAAVITVETWSVDQTKMVSQVQIHGGLDSVVFANIE